MTAFLYAFGSIIYDVLTIWLAMLGVLFIWDHVYAMSSKRRRRQMQGGYLLGATVFTTFALAAGTVDYYILTPVLGSGINFFFGS